jgi:hypothetical protein
MDLKNLSSNWKQLKQTLDRSNKSNKAPPDASAKVGSVKKRKRQDTDTGLSKAKTEARRRQRSRTMQVSSTATGEAQPNGISTRSSTTRPKVKVNAGWSTE